MKFFKISGTKTMEEKLKTQCVKVSKLRLLPAFNPNKTSKDNTFEEWLELDDSLYVGRHGRIFIGNSEDKKIFHYSASKWSNPFKVGKGKGKFTLDSSIQRYRNHILTSDLRLQLDELGGKVLGCWCDQGGKCHAKVLAELYTLRNNLPEPIEIIEQIEEEKEKPVQAVGICSAIKKDGKKCTYKAKYEGKCGVHKTK